MDNTLEKLEPGQMQALLSGNPIPAPAASTPITTTTTDPVIPITTPVVPTPEPVLPPAATAPVTPATPTPEPVTPTPAEVNYWEKLTNGQWKSEEDYKNFLNQTNTLQKQLTEAQSQPKFKSDRAKALFDYANQVDGMPLDAALNFLQLQRLDLTTLPDQQARFEAFKLKPEITSSGLSYDKIQKVFLEDDIQRFGDPASEVEPPTETQKIRAELATQQAKAELAKVKESYKSVQEEQKTPELIAQEQKQYRDFVQMTVGGFEGFTMEAKATDPDGEVVSGKVMFKVDPKTQLPQVVDLVSDPMGWWDKQLESRGIIDTQGKINLVKFAEFASKIQFLEENANALYTQGRHDMAAKLVKTHRNPQLPTTPNPTIPVVPVDEKEKLGQEFMKVAGMR